MAMIMNELPRLVCGPRFFTPMANSVGNMIDIKKNVATSATTDTPSNPSTTTAHSATLISA